MANWGCLEGEWEPRDLKKGVFFLLWEVNHEVKESTLIKYLVRRMMRKRGILNTDDLKEKCIDLMLVSNVLTKL